LRLGPCGGFGSQRAGADRIFVAHEVLGQKAEALLSSADVLHSLLVVAHDGSDVFEAREAIEVPYSERFGDAGDQLGG